MHALRVLYVLVQSLIARGMGCNQHQTSLIA
jgi:hypothetical protein